MVSLRIKDNDEFSMMVALNGMTKQDLSSAVGVNKTYFYRTNTTNKNISVKTANKIAKVLHKDIKDIFFAVNVD